MNGTYFLIGLIAASLVLYPAETVNAFSAVGLKVQIYYINYRMKWMAWRMYRSLKKMCREAGFPDPGPFRFVDLWDRKAP